MSRITEKFLNKCRLGRGTKPNAQNAFRLCYYLTQPIYQYVCLREFDINTSLVKREEEVLWVLKQ